MQSLEQSRHELELFFEVSLDLLCIADLDGHFVRLNPAWEETLGWKLEELEGRRFLELVHPDDRERTAGEVKSLAEGRVTVNFENRYLCRDGSYRWLLWKSRAVPERGAIYAAARDVTRRKEAEEKLRGAYRQASLRIEQQTADLRQTQALYRDIFDRAPVGICQTDSDGRFQAANPAMLEMLGCDSWSRLAERSIREVFAAPQDYQVLEEQLAAEGQVLEQEVRWRRDDGEKIWVRLDAVQMAGGAGESAGFQIFARDISRQRSLEEQLFQSQKMEAVGTLAGGIAHDFNNLLTVILGHLELMLEEEHPSREDLQEIQAASRRAARLTRQLLALSRQQVIHPSIVDLRQLVGDLESLLGRLLGEDIDLYVRSCDDKACVEADAGHLEQVVMNLAVNARDAMPRGGRLTLETSVMEIDEEDAELYADVPPGEYVCLAVSDTGTGFGEATRRRIFEPFFTTKEVGRGTGLGLSTVYGIVKQSRGHIGVYSEVDVGTVFKIYLPRVAADPSGLVPAPRPKVESRGGSETILLIEDEAALRGVMRKSLEREGYRILAAGDADAATKIAEEHAGRIHLVLSDVVLPGTSGTDLIDRIRRWRKGIPVIFMSGYTDAAVVRHGVLSEQTPFLQKPFPMKRLAAKIREVLNGGGAG